MPSGKRGRFPLGTPVLEAARQLGVDIESVCGGRAICGRCQIEVRRRVRQARDRLVQRPPLAQGRQGGALRPRARPARAAAASPARRRSSATSSSTCRRTRSQRAGGAQGRRRPRHRAHPAIQLCYVEVEEPDMHKPLGDLDRLKVALEKDWGWKDLAVDFASAAAGAEASCARATGR